MPGLAPERLGYAPDQIDPELRARSLRDATALAAAMQCPYEALVDEAFGDIFVLWENPDAIDETMRLRSLTNLHPRKYGPLFAQKFLTVTIDLGTDMATAFRSHTCVAHELSLRLVLDGVEILEEAYSTLGLPDDWRGWAEYSLFEGMDHETLYNPALTGSAATQSSPPSASRTSCRVPESCDQSWRT